MTDHTANAPMFPLLSSSWAIEESALAQLASAFQLHLAGNLKGVLGPKRSTMQSSGRVAIIPIVSTMLPYSTDLLEIFGGSVTGDIQADVERAASDPSIGAIFLDVDSPGGVSIGVSALSAAVSAAAQVKPVISFIRGMGCSAAYWAICGSTQILADSTAYIGSIGVRGGTRFDVSKMLATAGISAFTPASSSTKIAGLYGHAITDAQKADLQRTTDQLHAEFVRDVAKGRRLSGDALAAATDARVHIGRNANEVKLIDGIATYQQAMDRAQILAGGSISSSTNPAGRTGGAVSSNSSRSNMNYQEASAFVGERVRALQASKPSLNRSAAIMAVLRHDPALAAAYNLPAAGTPNPARNTPATGSALGMFNALVAEIQQAEGIDRRRASIQAAKDNPALHAAYLKETNPGAVLVD